DITGAGTTKLISSNFTAVLRGMRLWLEGGLGNDTLSARLANDNSASFGYDVLLRGGLGVDKIALTLTNVAGVPTFGPSGTILTEKGPGADILTNTITG